MREIVIWFVFYVSLPYEIKLLLFNIFFFASNILIFRSRGGNVEKNKVDGDKHRHNVNIKDLPKPVKNLPIGNEVHHIDIKIDSHKKNEDYFKIFNKMNEDIFRDNNFGFGINHDFEDKFKNIHLDPGFNRFPDRRRDISPGRFRDASPGRMIVESPGRERIGRDIFIDQG